MNAPQRITADPLAELAQAILRDGPLKACGCYNPREQREWINAAQAFVDTHGDDRADLEYMDSLDDLARAEMEREELQAMARSCGEAVGLEVEARLYALGGGK